MRIMFAVIALGFAIAAGPAYSASAAPVAKVSAKSMAKGGSFHNIHVKKQNLACQDCHADSNPDTLFVRNTEDPPAGLKAQVDRHECLACHRSGKAIWYGARN